MSTVQRIIAEVPGPNKAIIVPDGPNVSYDQLRHFVKDLKALLAALDNGGLLKQQDAVSISMPNSLEFSIAFLAVTGSTLIAAPLNPAYRQQEFEFYIDDMKSQLLIVPRNCVKSKYPAVAAAQKFGAAVAELWIENGKVVLNKVLDARQPSIRSQPVREPHSNDIAFVLHTSGTTGRPKAVPLLHRNMLATVRNIVGTYQLTEQDASYLVMPLFHVHGLMAGLLSPLSSGGTVIIPPKFSAYHFWDQFRKYGATWFTAVPTIHQILLKHPIPNDPKPQPRFVRSCSSALAPVTFHDLEKKLGCPVLEAYAMTEACHQMTSNSLPPDLRKSGTVGVGHGVDVVILDDDDNVLPPNTKGEICVRGPNVTPGYLHNAMANAESFTKSTGKSPYFRTGDQGIINDDGMLVITGRIKELINRGGEKISPIELDGVLLSHPAVGEVVAFGAPDELYGQEVNAVVVLKNGQTATESELIDFVAGRVAKHKVPTKIFFTKVMPKTATGKIQRRIIAEKFATPKSKL